MFLRQLIIEGKVHLCL